jgi:hypothetical protein
MNSALGRLSQKISGSDEGIIEDLHAYYLGLYLCEEVLHPKIA